MRTATAARPVDGSVSPKWPDGEAATGLVPAMQFVAAVRQAAKRQRNTREGLGVVRAIMRDAGLDLLREAFVAQAPVSVCVSEPGDGTFAALLMPCTREDVFAFVARVEARVDELAAARGLRGVNVVSAAMVSGPKKIRANDLLDATVCGLAEALCTAIETSPASLRGPRLIDP